MFHGSDERQTVPGWSVSGDRNLDFAVSLDSTTCAEVPGEQGCRHAAPYEEELVFVFDSGILDKATSSGSRPEHQWCS